MTQSLNLHSLEAGTVIFNQGSASQVTVKKYFTYKPFNESQISEDDRILELHNLTIKTFENLIQTLDGKKIMIPLSGGYDSRMVLTILKELGYDNIFTFTYGRRKDLQTERAEYFSKKIESLGNLFIMTTN